MTPGGDLNDTLLYAYKKSHRLLAVIYMLTDTDRAGDPLVARLRQEAVRVIKDMSENLRQGAPDRATCAVLRTLGDLVATAAQARVMSSMNARIIKDEYLGLADRLERELFAPAAVDTWAIGVSQREAQEKSLYRLATYIRHDDEKDTPRASDRAAQTDRDRTWPKAEKDTGSTARAPAPKETESAPVGTRETERHNDRRAAIFGILQRKPRITVKDVTEVIKDCSEKTIQRELLSMVDQGVLKKEGERRWSTYSLAGAA